MKNERFISKATQVHGDKYSYDLVEYVNNRTYVKIICPTHGVFEQTPEKHLLGQSCKQCSKRPTWTLKDFLLKAEEIYGDKYDYNKVSFTKVTDKITIVCPAHGEFIQQVNVHLKGKGCRQCGFETISSKLTKSTQDFILKAKQVHGDKYDYSKTVYTNGKTDVIVTCPIHGDFTIRPSNHLTLKRGCNVGCSKQACDHTRKDSEYFLKRAKEVHGDKFDYSLVEYEGAHKKVKIICPVHGMFEQLPSNHYKYDCLKCSRDKSIELLKEQENSFSKSGFKSLAKGFDCIFYIIRCWNNEEEFYKLGITKNTVKVRYQSKKRMPYNYEIVKELKGEAEYILTLENTLKKSLDSKYEPAIKFAGSTRECFTNIKSVINKLDELILEFSKSD